MPFVDFQVEDTGLNGAIPIRQPDGSWAMRPPRDLSGLPSDPWTYIRLAADFTTSSATAVDVVGLSFNPEPDKHYHIRGQFLLRTAVTATGPRPGCAWPGGCTDGVVSLRCTSTATIQVLQHGNISAAVLIPVGGLPVTNASFPADLEATMVVGPSPIGAFRIQLASETALTNVIMKAGSWLAYRVI